MIILASAIKETMERLHNAGMQAHTGGGAEIFDPEVRKIITTPEKISGEEYLNIAKQLHKMGINDIRIRYHDKHLLIRLLDGFDQKRSQIQCG